MAYVLDTGADKILDATTYPTFDFRDVGINRSPVDDHQWENGIIARQHYCYAWRRGMICNLDFSHATGASTPLTTNQTAFTAYAWIEAGTGGPLFTIDDYDAELSIRFYARVKVTAGTGTVQFRVNDGSDNRTALATTTSVTYEWITTTVAADKLITTGVHIAVYGKTDNGVNTLSVSNLAAYFENQGVIGV